MSVRNIGKWLICGMLFTGTATMGSNEVTNDAIIEEITELNKKFDAFQATINRRLSSIETSISKINEDPEVKAEQEKLEDSAKIAIQEIILLGKQAKFDEAKVKLTEFMKQFGQTRSARYARKYELEFAAIGKSAPENWGIEEWFQGKDEIALDSNNTTLLVFWEIWCPHCRNEVPRLKALYEEYKEEGLQIVGFTKVNKSATDDQVVNFLYEQKVNYPIAKEDGTVSQYFNVSGIPAAAVLKNGEVVWRGHPTHLSDELLKSWL